MTTIETICSHKIEFFYDTKSKNAIPDESETQHVESQLRQNYIEGELCLGKVINGRYYEFRGWWKILNN